MAETAEAPVQEVKQEVVTPQSPFSEGAWKAAPTLPVSTNTDTVIEEKNNEIKEDKPTVIKTDEVVEVKEEVKPQKVEVTLPEPIKFANPESEKIFNLIKDGKEDDVYSYLHEKKTLKSVDKLPAADIIKLNLQYGNKDFSPEDINDLFNERYQMPEKPIQDSIELDDEFKERITKYEKEVQKVENRITRDAKPAKTELLKLQKEIVLPDIQGTQPLSKEPTQEELAAQKLQTEAYLKTVDQSLEKFNGYSTTFKDEEVELQVAYVPSPEEKKELHSVITLAGTDAGAFLKTLGWLDDKGNINTNKLTEDLPLILSRDKVLSKLVSETGNKRHEASIKAIKNIDYSGKQNGSGEVDGETPEQKQERMAKHFYSQ